MVIRQIRQCRNALVCEGVEHVAVFGSVARGEASSKSDVDVVVDPSPAFTLFNLTGVREILEGALARPVDALTRKTVEASPFARTAAAEAVHVF
jgi:predicted nucleotidyltransferase